MLRIDFNMKKFKENDAKGSYMCVIHPVMKDDNYIIETMNWLCDYIRDKYDVEKLI